MLLALTMLPVKSSHSPSRIIKKIRQVESSGSIEKERLKVSVENAPWGFMQEDTGILISYNSCMTMRNRVAYHYSRTSCLWRQAYDRMMRHPDGVMFVCSASRRMICITIAKSVTVEISMFAGSVMRWGALFGS
jgi:hypothetical protein